MATTNFVTGATIAADWLNDVDEFVYGTTDRSMTSSLKVQSDLATPAGGTAEKGIQLGSSGPWILFGSGAPTCSAIQGSLYLRTDGSSTSTRLYVNTNGSTGWAAITTAS